MNSGYPDGILTSRIKIISQEICKEVYAKTGIKIDSKMLCAGERGRGSTEVKNS